MVGKLNKFKLLKWHDRRLLAEALFYLWAFRLAVSLVPPRRLRHAPQVVLRPHVTPDRLAWAVLAAAAAVPGCTCLVRALAVQRLFARPGHPSDFRIGVARFGPIGFAAHAWLEHAGKPVIGLTEQGQFASILSVTQGHGA
jgi:hypothetical protein